MKSIANLIVRFENRLRQKLRHLSINYDEARVPVYTLPDLLRFVDGRIVTGPKDWQENRREEILNLFQRHVYGYSPQAPKYLQYHQTSKDQNALGGLATRKEVTLFFTNRPDGPCIKLLLYCPNHVSKPVPAFLGLNFYGNHAIHPDSGINLTMQWKQPNLNKPPAKYFPSEEMRGAFSNRWPVEKILQHGYALATAYYGDLEPDFPNGWHYGIRSAFGVHSQPENNSSLDQEIPNASIQTKKCIATTAWNIPDNWGAIGAWAWGLSRMLDYLDQDTDIDASQSVLFGHSRLGKTALWAGAQDERFAIVIANNSGCCGAAISRRRFGETIKLINQVRPHWFCREFKNYNGKEDQLPFDQHMLIALMAPRPVYIASAEQDLGADPLGEFLAAKHADPVYALFGLPGLKVEQMPRLNESVGETIGYHIRSGKHDVTDYDWDQYLRFADRIFDKNSA